MTKNASVTVSKIGGGSITDAFTIGHVPDAVEECKGDRVILVVSAIGKTTRKLQKVADCFWAGNQEEAEETLEEIRNFHLGIVNQLLLDTDFTGEVDKFFVKSFNRLPRLKNKSKDPKFFADQILPLGEIVSSMIVLEILRKRGINIGLVNAVDFIKTNSQYGGAGVLFDKSKEKAISIFEKAFSEYHVVLTQGFIGSDIYRKFTTLGLDGSDYTQHLIAKFLGIKNITKFVNTPGVMTKDPQKYGDKAVLIPSLTRSEFKKLQDEGKTGNLLYHKCIDILMEEKISLRIRPFLNLNSFGTLING